MNAPKETPEWIEVLRAECDRSSQPRVARMLRQPDGFPSTTVISQVLNDKYPCPTDRLKALVEGIFMNGTITCPVLGEIAKDICIENQSRDYSSTNHMRVRIYQACHGTCSHSKVREEQ